MHLWRIGVRNIRSITEGLENVSEQAFGYAAAENVINPWLNILSDCHEYAKDILKSLKEVPILTVYITKPANRRANEPSSANVIPATEV